ncbi:MULTISPECIES: DMT family transporter [Legionella]|uniref:DMT family transporter n=1 Tax=Legionella TaxID=445 RepID=UPI000F8E5BCF|nr:MULTISPECIES: DMT family transporter [Legionella]MCP0913480.1 DMT family transporter [Legionella sp. 27cVA30]RUR11094.1 DMT family transporter [Legionella septentrionalis]
MAIQQHRGNIYAILSGFLYGFLGYFGLSVMQAGISASTMLFWRFLISSVVIFLILLPSLKRIQDSWRDIGFAFLNGAAFYSFSTVLYFWSCTYIGSGLAMVIFFTYPGIVILCNFFAYGQKISPAYYVAMFLIFMGMLLFVDLHEMKLDFIGIILAVISAAFYAFYIFFSKKNIISANLSALMVSLGCMLSCLFLSLLNQSFSIPVAGDVWLNLLGIGILSTAFPILLLLYSLRYVSSEKASILSVLEPVFVVLCGVVLLGETLKPAHILGVVIVLGGALLTLFSDKLRLSFLNSRKLV